MAGTLEGEEAGPRVPDHEGHLLGRDGLRGDDEVALILAVCRVKDDDEFITLCQCESETPSLLSKDSH